MKLMIKAVLGLVLLLGVGAADAWACSCMPSGTAAREFERSEVVVRVRLERVEDLKGAADDWIFSPRAKAVMRVERVYKGGLTVGGTIDLAQGDGANCRSMFAAEEAGQEYLLYMQDPGEVSGMYVASICGRSRRIDGAAADLKYLDRRAELEGKTMLAGVVHGAKPEGTTVTVRGGGRTIRRKADADGYFEIVGMRPGKYTISVPGEVRSFYHAPAGPLGSGGYATPENGAVAIEVKSGTMTEVGIHLK